MSLAFLLLPPLTWLVVAYLGSLAVLLVSALWTTDEFTGSVVRTFTTDNIVRVLTDAVFRTATLRTVGIALTVTLICAVLAAPLALYMAKVASRRTRLALVVAVTTPLWASYLVKAYAWRMMLSPEGPLHWATRYTPGYGLIATTLTLAYLWLPYMVIPVFAALERVPDHLIDASSDLGASDLTTLARVVGPLVFPGLIGGSHQRSIVLDYDPTTKLFNIHLAYPADRTDVCTLKVVKGTRTFTDCEGRTVTVDDLALPPQGVRPKVKAGELFLNLKPDTPATSTPATSTPATSTPAGVTTTTG